MNITKSRCNEIWLCLDSIILQNECFQLNGQEVEEPFFSGCNSIVSGIRLYNCFIKAYAIYKQTEIVNSIHRAHVQSVKEICSNLTMKTLNAKCQSLKFLWTICIVVRIFQFNARCGSPQGESGNYYLT